MPGPVVGMKAQSIFLDWDVDHHGWYYHARRMKVDGDRYVGLRSRPWLSGRVERWRKVVRIRPFGLELLSRRSSSGHIHVWVVLKRCERELSLAETMFLRYILLDDPNRLWRDVVRDSEGDRTNRLFDTKSVNGEIRKAGEWEPWD